MRNENLFALLQSGFPANRSRPALTLADGNVWSYGQLEETAGRIASLLESLGGQPGDRLAAQVEKSPEAVALYLGCLMAGIVFLPLNTAYTTVEISYFLEDAEPRFFVCRPQTSALPIASGTLCLTLGDRGEGSVMTQAATQSPRQDVVRRSADDLAAICYTSGTTGRSKGAMLTHGNLAANAQTLVKLWGFERGETLLHALPIFHVHGLFVALHTGLLMGCEFLFLPKFDPPQVLALLPRARIMMGVPTFYTRLLSDPSFGRSHCASVRLFIAGSAPLLAETHREFTERIGHAILERYGMTETGMLTSNPLQGERRPGSVGFPLPDVTLRIADETGKALPTGSIGVVEVKGPNVFPGYWRRPERRAEDFRPDGFFITGDVGLLEKDGRVTLVGRAKDLIITGGFNVYPKEVELLLDALPGVEESAVIGLPHSDFGEAVTAVITVKGAVDDEATMIAHCKTQLAGFKVPKRILQVKELPRNAMGKVQKNLLREAYKDLYS